MRSDHDLSPQVRRVVAAVGAVALLVPFTVIAALLVGDVGWLRRLDLRATDAMYGYALGHPGWVRFMTVWSTVFHPMVWRVAALVLVVWLARRGARALAWWVGITMAAGGLLGVLLKLLFVRHRPDLPEPVARAVGYAFPSGHAFTNALGATVFLVVLLPQVRHRRGLRALLWAAAVVVPLVTCVSRVALGVHWSSDVVAGWLLGVAVAVGAAATFPVRSRGPARVGSGASSAGGDRRVGSRRSAGWVRPAGRSSPS